jgi:hypothetical protein
MKVNHLRKLHDSIFGKSKGYINKSNMLEKLREFSSIKSTITNYTLKELTEMKVYDLRKLAEKNLNFMVIRQRTLENFNRRKKPKDRILRKKQGRPIKESIEIHTGPEENVKNINNAVILHKMDKSNIHSYFGKNFGETPFGIFNLENFSQIYEKSILLMYMNK